MSLFRIRELWGAEKSGFPGEEFHLGSLAVGRIVESETQSEQIVVGSLSGVLRVYDVGWKMDEGKEGLPYRPDHLLLETQVEGPILQVGVGLFVSGIDALHIAVLTPRNISIYHLKGAVSHQVDHGSQYVLEKVYQHTLQRSAYNFVSGPFGGVSGRDFICVQSLDGCLSVFEQESFAFSRFLPGALLPGPLAYVPMSDSFLTVSSTWLLESYKYQNLAVASQSESKEDPSNVTSGKRVAPDWKIQLGENALSLSVVEMSPAQPSILVLGERNLFCFTEGGTVRFLKKLPYSPSCMLTYSATSEGFVQYLVGTHTKSVMFYSDNLLRWSAQLNVVPVSVLRVQISPSLLGMLVVLDSVGHLTCSYLGTDPALFGLPQTDTRYLNYPQRQSELRSLQSKIKNSSKPLDLRVADSKDELTLSCKVPERLDEISLSYDCQLTEENTPSITVKVGLSVRVPLENVQLYVVAPTPLVAHQSSFSFSTLTGSQDVAVTFFVRYSAVSWSLCVRLQASYVVGGGGGKVTRTEAVLPLSLVSRLTPPLKTALHKFTLDTNKPTVPLYDLFPEFGSAASDSGGQGMGFQPYGIPAVVTILASKTSQKYRVQSENFESVWLFCKELRHRLIRHFAGTEDFGLWFAGTLPLAEYFSLLDQHFQIEKKMETLDHLLGDKGSQLRAVEKQLLTKFKDTTPTPLAHLDGLFEMTYRQVAKIIQSMQDLINQSQSVGSSLNAATQLLLFLIKLQTKIDPELFAKVESALTFHNHVVPEQIWEERADVGVTYLLQLLSKGQGNGSSVQEIPKLTDTTRLKKHIALLCDKLNKGYTPPHNSLLPRTQTPVPINKPIRGPALKGRLETIVEDTNTTDVSDTPLGQTTVPAGSAFGEITSGQLTLPEEEVEEERDEFFAHQNNQNESLEKDQERRGSAFGEITSGQLTLPEEEVEEERDEFFAHQNNQNESLEKDQERRGMVEKSEEKEEREKDIFIQGKNHVPDLDKLTSYPQEDDSPYVNGF